MWGQFYEGAHRQVAKTHKSYKKQPANNTGYRFKEGRGYFCTLPALSTSHPNFSTVQSLNFNLLRNTDAHIYVPYHSKWARNQVQVISYLFIYQTGEMTFVNCSLGQHLLEPLHTFSANEDECYLFGRTFLNIHPFVYHIWSIVFIAGDISQGNTCRNIHEDVCCGIAYNSEKLVKPKYPLVGEWLT